MKYRCPKCEGDELVIAIETKVRLYQHGTDDMTTELLDTDHNWNENSPMTCLSCGFQDKVIEFEYEPLEDGWAVFNGTEIQRLDDSDAFQNDFEARGYVLTKALDGSEYHKDVLWRCYGITVPAQEERGQ